MRRLHALQQMPLMQGFSSNMQSMGKQIKEIQIAGLSCTLYLPPNYSSTQERYPVIYVNGEISVEEVITEVKKNGAAADFLLISIRPTSWNDDFTPWGAPVFRKGEEAPAGNADNYIRCLTDEIKPFIDANYRTKPEPEHTVLLGYSLGGLAALYAIYKTDRFGVVGSLSGSLWYDNFCEFMEKEKPLRTDLRVYLSLGKKESLSKNPRMAKVAECTERTREILVHQIGVDAHGVRVEKQNRQTEVHNIYFEWNEGGHFHEIPKRFARAIAWCACQS